MKYQSTCVIVLSLLLSGCQRDISGTYLASDKDATIWLQVVRTPDNHLAGQIDVWTLSSNGKTKQDSSPITGAINAENVTLSTEGLLGLGSATLGGTLDGNTLTLSGPSATSLILKRAEFREYQRQLDLLNAESAQIVAEKEVAAAHAIAATLLANDLSEMNEFVTRMDHIDTEASLHLAKFQNAEKRYQANTATIAKDVDQERELPNNNETSFARSQLMAAAYHAARDTNQLHVDAISLQSAFEANVKPIWSELSHFADKCRTVPSGTSMAGEVQAHNDSCKRLSNIAPIFRQKSEALESGLAHLDQVYARENERQQQLIRLGEKLQP